jgi:predicted ATPase
VTFRIARVITTSDTNEPRLLHSKYRQTPPPISGVLLPFSNDLQKELDGNWFTIILGRNATGKSQLLSDIAEAFCIASGEFTSRRRSSLNISMDVDIDGHKASLEVSRNKLTPLSKKCLPSRVVTSATTPFDKFRLSKDVIRERVPFREDEPKNAEQYYFYSGLRDSNGRTNFRSSILRTIRGIFCREQYSLDRLNKLKSIFSFLGLDPIVEIELSVGALSSSRELIDIMFSPDPLKKLEHSDKSSMNSRRLLSYLKSGGLTVSKVQSALTRVDEIEKRFGLQNLEMRIDQSSQDKSLLEDIFLLRDLRLVNFREVSIRRSNSDLSMSILEASSGEISIIAGILGIAAGIQDNSLILIDEPEISLHPEWQDRYLELLRETFSSFHGCHFVIATHSPLILSDAKASDTTVLNISHIIEGIAVDKFETGASTDELLAKEFGVVGDDNLFLKQEVIKAANSIAQGDINSVEFQNRVSALSNYRNKLGENSKIGKIIGDMLDIMKSDQ